MDLKKTNTFQNALCAALGEENVFSAEPMSAHTTFKIGGPADWLVTPTTADQVRAAVLLCREHDVPSWIVGAGSNLLVSDDGLRGVVIHIGDRMAAIRVEGNRLFAQAGASNMDVARCALDAGLAGYEFASGIPGSIGGAAIMNAGAYGGEFEDVAVQVDCLNPATGEFVEFTREEARWSYRHSRMMDEGLIVLGAVLELQPDNPADIKARLKDFAHRRSSKQPLEYPSAGSTFKRPDGYYVGPMIEQLGLKGVRIGGAQVSEKHAGFVINAGDATARDVLDLIAYIQGRVHDAFGVDLEPEVRLLGFE